MPSLSQQLENHTTGHFGFSATPLRDLVESSYTLVTLVIDNSGSVLPFSADLEKMLGQIVDSCMLNPKVNNLLLRIVTFGSRVNELHGFKMLASINKGDYINSMNCGGGTALFDACVSALEATENYGKELKAKDYDTNTVTFIITDGDDNQSSLTVSRVRDMNNQLTQSEAVESSICVLVKVNAAQYAAVLDQFAMDVGMPSIDIGAATPSSLAKLGGMISQSISSQSKSVGSGQAAAVTF